MYSIDTSALLDGLIRSYPQDTFPTLWRQVDGLVDASRLRACRMVHGELSHKADDAFNWLDGRPGMIVELDAAIQAAGKAIVAQFPGLVDLRRHRSGADPFVIAVAQVQGLTVVTGEKPTNNPARPKIPDVCAQINLPCISFLGLINAEGWRF